MTIRSRVVRAAKRVLPRWVLDVIAYMAERRYLARLGTTDRRAVFSGIYEEGIWGGRNEGADFYSGSGSHDLGIVGPYVSAVSQFLGQLDRLPIVVEVGCGDFFVGSQLVGSSERYVACDIVASLIERNRGQFIDPRLSFQVLDAVVDDLPKGDVLVIRQVLQHLSNADIVQVAGKLVAYRHVIVTEHWPPGDPFVPNLDKPTGFDVRINRNSGVVLTAAPFNLRPTAERVLCEVSEAFGRVRTIAYSN
jgi:hypothetical protein